ncbi:hypothetical protein DVH24_035746 [Malus domestica]|uniref:Uncharacterized protein n=1 Tax=Malus domestica TaxID=3750 RepID=A0A498JMV5_MALDO|nr:hypothetical protein DVH24_035746 [Malus domestica]
MFAVRSRCAYFEDSVCCAEKAWTGDEYEDYEDNEDGEEYEEEEENSEEFHLHYICTLQFPVGLKSSIFFHMLTSLLQRNIQKDEHGMKP